MSGAYILAPLGAQVSAWEKTFFRDADPFGFILFARNIETPDQLRKICADLRDTVGRDAPILIDQEGGRVQRLRAPHWREWMPPLELARLASDPQRAFYLRYRIIAHELRAVGIDANCAPTCDIAQADTHPFLKNRCLGETPTEVIANAQAAINGHLDGGVLPVVKHMPGHGRGKVDSHLGLPTADVSLTDAASWDFAPFRALSSTAMGMSAHIVFPDAGELPATQNPKMIDLIRDDIGFGGLLMTDDISMEALSGTVAERARLSIDAGCDVVLHCNGVADEMAAIAREIGDMSAQAHRRGEMALMARRQPEKIDIQALEAEFGALLT